MKAIAGCGVRLRSVTARLLKRSDGVLPNHQRLVTSSVTLSCRKHEQACDQHRGHYPAKTIKSQRCPGGAHAKPLLSRLSVGVTHQRISLQSLSAASLQNVGFHWALMRRLNPTRSNSYTLQACPVSYRSTPLHSREQNLSPSAILDASANPEYQNKIDEPKHVPDNDIKYPFMVAGSDPMRQFLMPSPCIDFVLCNSDISNISMY